MLVNLTVIISVYCIMRLLWEAEKARVGVAGKPSMIYSILTGLAICVIAWMCIEVVAGSMHQAKSLEDAFRGFGGR